MYLARLRVRRFFFAAFRHPHDACATTILHGHRRAFVRDRWRRLSPTQILMRHEANLSSISRRDVNLFKAHNSRYTINEVFYSVPCAYAREAVLLRFFTACGCRRTSPRTVSGRPASSRAPPQWLFRRKNQRL